MALLNLRKFVRAWTVTNSVLHGVQRELRARIPFPIDSEETPFTVYPSDQTDNSGTHLNRLAVNSHLQAMSPAGFTVDLRSTQRGDLQTAKSHLSFYMIGGEPGSYAWSMARKYKNLGETPIEYIPSDSKNNMHVPDYLFYTGDGGWMDVRQFSRFSLTAAGSGQIDISPEEGAPDNLAYDLSFDGEIRVEYRNYRFEPSEGTLLTATVDGERHELINPMEPVDISGIGWIRVAIVSNNSNGICALFGMLQ
jgi:hypothetical protein